VRILAEPLGHVKNEGTARTVVHGSVVDAVAVDRLSDADVIEVSREDNIFVLESGVAAGNFGDEVGRLDSGDIDSGFCCERNSERKMRQWLSIFAESSDFFEGVAGARQDFFGARRIDGDGYLRALGFVELGIVEIHRGMG